MVAEHALEGTDPESWALLAAGNNGNRAKSHGKSLWQIITMGRIPEAE
jgi:hypothetical protein